MKREVRFSGKKFSPAILRRAIDAGCRLGGPEEPVRLGANLVDYQEESWSFDSFDEFFAEYSKLEVERAYIYVDWGKANIELQVSYFDNVSRSDVKIKAAERNAINTILAPFREAEVVETELPPRTASQTNPEISIFIGHGGNPQWRRLKDHLGEKHGYKIVAYETGARSGHTIRDILEEMSNRASIAFLVLTGEDKTEARRLRARQNVIHECGLFQGVLGFDRGILLVEKGVELASNFDGVQQIRFTKSRIEEAFGDVLAVLKREFGTT